MIETNGWFNFCFKEDFQQTMDNFHKRLYKWICFKVNVCICLDTAYCILYSTDLLHAPDPQQ